VSSSLATALRGTGSVGKALTESVADVASGVIQGTTQVGGDLGKATKGAVIGMLQGTKEVGGETLAAVQAAANTRTAHEAMRANPCPNPETSRQNRLKHELGWASHDSKQLEQWQYEGPLAVASGT
jgi:hypothetical protein